MRVYGHTRTMMRGTVGMSVLALACTQPAFAQSGPANESEIVVTGITATTATKTDTPILRIPQAIEVVTIEEIQDRGAQNIREALKYTRSEEHTSELQSLIRISYAVFCLKKKK